MEIIVHDEIRSKIFLQYFQILSENQVSAAKEFVTELEQRSSRFNEQLNRFDSDVNRFEDQITEFDSNLGDFDNKINRLTETIDYIEAIEGQDDLDKDELRELEQRLQGLKSISEGELQEAVQAIGEERETNSILTNILVSVLKLDIADANKYTRELEEYARQLELLENIYIYSNITGDVLDIKIKNHGGRSIYLHFLFESAIGKLLPKADQMENILIPTGTDSSPYSKNVSVDLEPDNKQIPVHDWITIRVFCSKRKLDDSDELSSNLTSIYSVQVTKGNRFFG